MADITITDGVSLSADVKLSDNAPVAKAKLTQLLATGKAIFDCLSGPIDESVVTAVTFGASFTSPNLLPDSLPSVTVGPGMNCGLTIRKPSDKLLFADDGFSPTIPITTGEAWLGFELDLGLSAAAAATVNGIGASLTGSSKITCCNWNHVGPQTAPLPSLLTCLETALSNFSVITSAASLRAQLPDTVMTTEVTGDISAGVSVEQPFTLNPLASASLPFSETASIQPSVTVKLGTSIKLSGDIVVRSFKVTNTLLRLGVYKKHGSTMTATLTAGAGIEGELGGTDIVSTILNGALPGVDAAAAGIGGGNAKELNDVIRSGLSRSLSAQVNACCSAALTDEAALLYDVHLDEGDQNATDGALQLAMRGDWTALEHLPNAQRRRNIAVETQEKRQSITLNLFGFYSATSTTDYLQSSTVLVDESGQLSIIDKVDASRISATTTPYASDSAKLRQALIEDFLCTASYAAVGGQMQLNLTALQSYSDYSQDMGRAAMRQDVCLGYALNLIPAGSLDEQIASTPLFKHALVDATVRYDSPALLDIFFSDPQAETTRSREDIERAGRDAMCQFLDPNDQTDALRLSILKNDVAWQAMDEIGNTSAFDGIPALSQLNAAQLGAITADWASIVWWADALAKVAPAISVAFKVAKSLGNQNPASDPNFTKARRNLASVLGAVTRKTDAAFVHGWGAAVLFALSGRHGKAQMDLTWNSKTLHYPS